MKRLILLVAMCLLVSGISATPSGYGNGTLVNVTADAATSPLTNYPVVITLSNASGISGAGVVYTNGTTRPDWGDVNITSPTSSLYTFWLNYNESTTTTIPLYVNVTSIGTTGKDAFVVYYGNSSMTTSRSSALPTLLQFHGAASTSFNDTDSFNPVNTSYRSDIRYSTRATNGLLLWGVSSDSSMLTDSQIFQPKPTTNQYVYTFNAGTNTQTLYSAISSTSYHKIQINRTNTYANFTVDSQTPVKITTNLPTVNLGLAMSLGDDGVGNQNWSFVRKWVVTEPTTSGYLPIIKYGGIGDSFSNATYGNSMWLYKMRSTHDAGATALINADGDGWTSADCLNNFSAKYSPNMTYFIVECGINDIRGNINGTATGNNLKAIYNLALTNGSTPVVLMPILEDPITRGDISANITLAQGVLTANGIPYVKWYDAMDTVPNNSAMDSWSATYTQGDGIHPNLTGNARLAEYLWTYYFSGSMPLSASFTQSPNPSTVGQSVTFTNTSAGSPTTWNWTINDVVTNTTQNIAYTFTTVGTYYIDLNVTNSTGSFSNITHAHTVVNASGFTPQDIWMEQQLLQTWHITDSSTGLPIPVVQLQDSAMQTFTTTNGTGYLTEEFGPSTVVFMATGYNSKAVSYFFDSEATHTVQMVASSPAPVPNTNTIFSPRLVRLRSVDQWRTPLTPVTITASYIADTLPNNDPVYLQNAFGVSESVVNLMMNSSIAMSGTTGSDGSNTFSMFPALTYNLTVTNETMGVHCQQNLAPADTDYVLFCPTDAQKAAVVPLSQTLNRSYIWITEPNASFVTINASYQDPDGLTSSVLFNVTVVDNNTVIYSKDFGNPGTSQVLDNYTMPNIRGMQIKSYLAYNRST